MITTLPWLLPAIAGALVGSGVFLFVRHLVPAEPDFAKVAARISGTDVTRVEVPTDADPYARIGGFLQRRLTTAQLARILPSHADLDLVGKTSTQVLGTQIVSALIALVLLPFAGLFSMLGVAIPMAPAAGVTLLLAALAFFAPGLEVRSAAKSARADFSRAVVAYLELIAIERISGSGATQAIDGAARVAKSWPYLRITEALDNARWAGESPWNGLEKLAEELQVRELRDVADIMRMAGSQDAAVYVQLRARARSLRSSQLTREQERAAEDSTRMTIPVTATAFVFVGMLLFPMIMKAFV